MKLAFVGPVHPYRGGIAQFNARLVSEMSIKDDCLIINFSRLYPDFLFPGKTQFDKSAIQFGYPAERLIDSINPLSWRKASHGLKSWKPDAVIFHYWHPFFIPAYTSIARSIGADIPRVAICHNITPHEGTAFQKILTRYLLSNIDGFMVHAKSEGVDLLRLKSTAIFKSAFHPLYDNFPGQDISRKDARYKLNIEPNCKLALYFGLIRPYKGVDLFFEASKHLLDIPDLKMLAVGEVYGGKSILENQIKSLAQVRAEFIDRYIPNEEVSLYFRASDLVVLPYRSATQSGVVPIAYACNRPVVVTDVGGLSEVVSDGESGYIVPPNDVLAIAGAIRKFFNLQNSNDFNVGLADMRKKLSWSRYGELLRELITEVRKP